MSAVVCYKLLDTATPRPPDTLRKSPSPEEHPPVAKTSTKPYEGSKINVADAFTVTVPNGWQGSISTAETFTAIMFARPNQLTSLVYDKAAKPSIANDGIASWNGLTEHFFILAPTSSQQFTPSAHENVSSESFTFNDGTVGKKYYVVKYAEEAKKWGGLQRDTEWQGRTYIYEKNGIRIEAHLALYPSTKIDIPFFEETIKSITANN